MSRRHHILVIDEDEQMLDLLCKVLGEHGCRVSIRTSALAALKVLDADPVDVVLADVHVRGLDGLHLLGQIKRHSPGTMVILMTAFGSIDAAVEAMKGGATDYVTKPFKMDEMLVVLDRALEHRALARELEHLREEVSERHRFGRLIGKSKSMQLVFDLIERVAPVRSTVLITGRSGTGKELVAQAIHTAGDRAGAPFIAVNCAAIPEALLESELYGHVAGSFTGAVGDKPGLFEEADGGTLFLDEIGEIPLAMQAKLLRTLQDRRVRRVGGTTAREVDVRLIAATNQDLEQGVREGRFREDLFFRINVITINLPPLVEHAEDIPLLARHFLERYARDYGRPTPKFSSAALHVIMGYEWPGNVRELENAIEHAVALCRGSTIQPTDLPRGLTRRREDLVKTAVAEGLTLGELEERYIRQVLEQTRGNQVKAAERLGIDRKTLYRKLKKNRVAQ